MTDRPTEFDARLGAGVRRLLEVAADDPIVLDGLAALADLIQRFVNRPPAADTSAAPSAVAGVGADDGLESAVDLHEAAGAHAGSPTQDASGTPPVAEADAPPEEPPLPDRDALFALIAPHLATRTPEPVTRAVPEAAPPADGLLGHPDTDIDAVLPGIRDRSALKADLARAVLQRAADGLPLAQDLLHRLRSAGASTWVADLVDPDTETLRQLASTFDAVSDTADLVLRLRESDERDRAQIQHALGAFAAVQSALRIQTAELRRTADDDQVAAFEWLKAVTARERIFIERHMRLEDPLDPDGVDAVMSGIRDGLEALRDQEERRRARVEEVKRLRYHAGRLAKGEGSERDVAKAVEAASAAVEAGIPPSNLDLRVLLLPVLDRLPRRDVPRPFALVLREIDGAMEAAHEKPSHRAGSTKPTSDEVLRVRKLLSGTTMVIIGGEERPEARQALTQAFALGDLDWHTLSDDPSLERLYRAIRRPGVSIVLYLIRWARHGFGDASDVADEQGVPFIRIPAGYNPVTVAHEVLEQASERLAKKRAPIASDP